jgi:hypothetical protein
MNEVTLCNLALARISAQQIQALDEANSVSAQYCDLMYHPVRQALLRKFDWAFAKKTKPLALTTEKPLNWEYEYQLPSDCLKVRGLTPLEGNAFVVAYVDGEMIYTTDPGQAYAPKYEIVAGRKIHTNLKEAHVVYTADITDLNEFDSLSLDVFRLRMAHDICMPITGKLALLSGISTELQAAYTSASSVTANESNRITRQTSRTSDLVEAML